jgi:enamine deaminase RidA (YjgF/YER057c/UK114 family)
MRTAINPPEVAPPLAPYSHAVVAPVGARILFASGQLGATLSGEIPEDVEAQAVLCFENIKAILASADMTFDDVVRFTGFVTDRAFFPIYSAVRARYVPKPLFASTLVIVSGFTLPQFKVEVEVTAMK